MMARGYFAKVYLDMWELCLDTGIGPIDAILYADFHGIEQVGSKRAILIPTWLVSRCMRGCCRECYQEGL